MAQPKRVKPEVLIPYPSEFQETKDPQEVIAREILGHPGRLVGGSKSFYKYKNPTNIVIFNSNILTKSKKIWYGDIDVTLDHKFLKKLAKKLGEEIFVFYESEARFGKEKDVDYKNATLMVLPSGGMAVKGYENWFYVEKGVPKSHTDESYYKAYPEKLEEQKRCEEENRKKRLQEVKEKNYYAVEIPAMSDLRSRSKTVSPIDKLYSFYAEQHGEFQGHLYFINTHLPERWHEDFDALLLNYYQKVHKYDDYLSNRIVNESCWYTPMNMGCDPEWIKPGFGYVRKEGYKRDLEHKAEFLKMLNERKRK